MRKMILAILILGTTGTVWAISAQNIEVITSQDRITIRWQIADEVSGSLSNHSRDFSSTATKQEFEDAIIASIKAGEAADTLRNTYAGKVLTVDQGGKIVISDKPAVDVSDVGVGVQP